MDALPYSMALLKYYLWQEMEFDIVDTAPPKWYV